MSSNLSPKVQHQILECPRHGHSPHSSYVGGNGNTPVWRCNKCEVERQREYRKRKASGAYTRPRSSISEKPVTVCTTCWLAHPAGECDR